MATTNLTAARARELFYYCPIDGTLTRRVDVLGRFGKAGTIASSVHRRTGYMRVGIDRARYATHRVIWLYVTGDWPSLFIDHIDGDRANNRWINLRMVTKSENAQNQRCARSNNKSSGILGVQKDSRGRWRAKIHVDHRQVYLGTFDSPSEASDAYIQAKRLYHPAGML